MRAKAGILQSGLILLGLAAAETLADAEPYDFLDFLGDMVEVEDEMIDAMSFEAVEFESTEDMPGAAEAPAPAQEQAGSDAAKAE